MLRVRNEKIGEDDYDGIKSDLNRGDDCITTYGVFFVKKLLCVDEFAVHGTAFGYGDDGEGVELAE